ncbi:MAG: rhomboid family intramembrane serine protease [Halodesulfurarchaeum sp.]
MDLLTVGARLAILVAFVLAIALVFSLRPPAETGSRLRTRLLFGLPIGTLLSIGLVAAFFLFVQGDWGHETVLTLPFTSWSLRYPLGMATAPIAHQGLGHLVGNLAAFLIFGSIGEYAFGHFPTRRGASAFGSWRRNPYVRAFGLVPAGVFGVALLTSLFAWGPIIGFSGVVYATVGYVLINYPFVAVVGLVAREFAITVFWSLRDPILTASAGSSYGSPWWADVAIQTHLLGLLLGVGLGLAIRSRRPQLDRLDPWRLFPASVLVGSSLTLWAVWWYAGPGSFQLFRGPGVVLVLGVALLITVAGTLQESPVAELSRRQVSVGLIVFPIVLMGAVAMPINLTASAGDFGPPGQTVSVDGYEIGYGDEVEDPRFEPINLSVVDTPDPPTVSGVIVANPDRHVFTEAISTGRLENDGRRTVTVGGLNWRETVTIERTGWRAAGGNRAYTVAATTGDGAVTPLHESEPATANTVVAGHELAIAPDNGSFVIEATAANGSSVAALPDRVPVPESAESVRLGELTIENNESVIWVERSDTRVPVFEAENR